MNGYITRNAFLYFSNWLLLFSDCFFRAKQHTAATGVAHLFKNIRFVLYEGKRIEFTKINAFAAAVA